MTDTTAVATDARRRHGAVTPIWLRAGFGVPVVLCLALIGLNGILVLRPTLYDGILNPFVVRGAASHFSGAEHRIHDLGFAVVFAVSALGLLAQLRSPARHLSGQIQAIIPWAAMAAMYQITEGFDFPARYPKTATLVYGGLTVSALLLHPAARRLPGELRPSRLDRRLVALTGIAALPQLVFAATNLDLQAGELPQDIHWLTGHYGHMFTYAATSLALALLASLQPTGWRLTAWTAAALPIALGVMSVLYPDSESGLALPFALAAIAWGVAFAAAAERRHRQTSAPTGITARHEAPA